jgi:hypothetical protein
MTTTKAAKRTHMVQVKIELDLMVPLGASSLEEVISLGRDLKVTDVVDLTGVEINDYSIRVRGAYEIDGP